MLIGEKIRQLRQASEMTQPALASALGIEQSYLSKLENGKSLPSAELFEQLLRVFKVTKSELLTDLHPLHIERDLSQIPAIKDTLQASRLRNKKLKTHLLLMAGCCFVLGMGVLATYFTKLYHTVNYQYISYGIVLPGESKDIFRNWQQQYLSRIGPEFKTATAEMHRRKDEMYVSTSEYRGEVYSEALPDNRSRTYYREGQRDIPNRLIEALALAIAVMLLAASIYLLYVERRLAR